MAEDFKVNEEEERKIIIDKYEKGREKVLLGGKFILIDYPFLIKNLILIFLCFFEKRWY